jgi:hypothetical protein
MESEASGASAKLLGATLPLDAFSAMMRAVY